MVTIATLLGPTWEPWPSQSDRSADKFKMATHTEVVISAATWETVHQLVNRELHEEQEEAMIPQCPLCIMFFQGCRHQGLHAFKGKATARPML